VLEKFKDLLKERLKQKLNKATCIVENKINQHYRYNLPYCPPHEGNFLSSLISKNAFKNCLEIGFYTGSTALYLTHAISKINGSVTSICIDDKKTIERGIQLLATLNYEKYHKLLKGNSNEVLPTLFLTSQKFDFIFVDGWKTFDHLALEIYYLNQLLIVGGIILFDDCYMPSVRKVISLLKKFYGYEEVDYIKYNHGLYARIYNILVYRSFYMPYRAFRKTIKTKNQDPFKDWNFHRRF